MSKITEYARGKACTARIPGVCNHNPETSVWAHIRGVRWGSGTGKKPPDVCGLIACSACHDVIDGRVPSPLYESDLKEAVYEGHMESLAILVRDGVIK